MQTARESSLQDSLYLRNGKPLHNGVQYLMLTHFDIVLYLPLSLHLPTNNFLMILTTAGINTIAQNLCRRSLERYLPLAITFFWKYALLCVLSCRNWEDRTFSGEQEHNYLGGEWYVKKIKRENIVVGYTILTHLLNTRTSRDKPFSRSCNCWM